MSRPRIVLGIVIIAALAVLGYGAYWRYGAPVDEQPATPSTPAEAVAGPAVVSAEGRIVPAREADLAFRTAGQVTEILVVEGQVVRAGDPLIRLWSADLEAGLAQAEAALALAKANRDALLAGPRAEEIRAAEERVSAANAAVAQASAGLAQLEQGATADQIAAAKAAVAQAEAARQQAQIAYDKTIPFSLGAAEEQARANLHAAEENLAAAQAALDQLLAGPDAEAIRAAQAAVWAAAAERDVATAQLELLRAGPTQYQQKAAEAQVMQAQAALEAARAALDQATLNAPFAGTLAQINVEVGELAAPGVAVVKLADFSRWQMETDDLAETDIVLVRPGQTATVTVDAFPGRSFTGTVASMAAVSETTRGNVTYRVTIVLDPTEAPLRWGMTAFADIDVEAVSP